MKVIKPIPLPNTKDILFNREKVKKTYYDLSFAKAMLDFYMNTKVIYEKIKARRVDDDFHLIRNSISTMTKAYEKAIAMTKLKRGMALQLPGFNINQLSSISSKLPLMFQITTLNTSQTTNASVTANINIPPEAERVYFLGITAGGSGASGGGGGGGGGGGSASSGNGTSAAYGGGGGSSGAPGSGGGGGSSGQAFFFYVPVSQLPSPTLQITVGTGGLGVSGASGGQGGSGGAEVLTEITDGNNGTAGSAGANGNPGNNGGSITIVSGSTTIAQLSGGIGGGAGQGGSGGNPGSGATTSAVGSGGSAPTPPSSGGAGGGSGTTVPTFTFASFVRQIIPVPGGNPLFQPGGAGLPNNTVPMAPYNFGGNGLSVNAGSSGSGSNGGNGGNGTYGGLGGYGGILTNLSDVYIPNFQSPNYYVAPGGAVFLSYVMPGSPGSGGSAGDPPGGSASSSICKNSIGTEFLIPIYGAGSPGSAGGSSGGGGGGGISTTTTGGPGGSGGNGASSCGTIQAGSGYILVVVI